MDVYINKVYMFISAAKIKKCSIDLKLEIFDGVVTINSAVPLNVKNVN